MERLTNIKFNFNNITEEQGLALYAMFKHMEYNGNIGHSEWTAFMTDGDGSFQPKITVEGINTETNQNKKRIEKAKRNFHKDNSGKRILPWTDSMSLFDFDGLCFINEKGEFEVK